MSPFKRLLRRIPPLRWCAYQYARQVRRRQADARALGIQAILATLGNVIIGWAGVERMLDELIAYYQHQRTNLETEHPRSLSSKLKYLRVMERDESFPAGVREFLHTARIEAKRLGDERHELIHGLLHQLSSKGWRTQRVIYDGPLARIQHRRFSVEEIRGISAEISKFGSYLSPKIWVIIGGDPRRFAAGDLEQTRRELGMTHITVRIPKANLEL